MCPASQPVLEDERGRRACARPRTVASDRRVSRGTTPRRGGRGLLALGSDDTASRPPRRASGWFASGATACPRSRPSRCGRKLLAQVSDFTVLALIGAARDRRRARPASPPLPGRGASSSASATRSPSWPSCVINAVLGLVQERKAERALTALREMTAPTARVRARRQDRRRAVGRSWSPATWCCSRTAIASPADVRLIEAHDLEVDEARAHRRERAGGQGRRAPRSPPTRRSPSAAPWSFMGTRVSRGRGARHRRQHRHATPSSARSPACWRASSPRRRRSSRISSASASAWCIGCIAVSALVFAAGLLHGAPGAAARAVPRRGGARGGRHPRGAAGGHHHRAGARHAAHGAAQRAGAAPARRRDAGLRAGHLHRQDRHAHAERDDGAHAVGRRRALRRRRRSAPARRRHPRRVAARRRRAPTRPICALALRRGRPRRRARTCRSAPSGSVEIQGDPTDAALLDHGAPRDGSASAPAQSLGEQPFTSQRRMASVLVGGDQAVARLRARRARGAARARRRTICTRRPRRRRSPTPIASAIADEAAALGGRSRCA